MILNIWLRSDSHDHKPVKVKVVDGIPVAEIDEDEKVFRLTPSQVEHYFQQLAIQGYNLTR